MHIDARSLDNNSIIEGDICIVGAGAAGISIALELMDTPHKVILLEGGGFQYEERIQELYNGKTTGQPYYPLKSSELHYFGGTTGHWGGMCSMFDPIAFQKRDWVDLSGWPITQEDLLPYYKKAHKNLDIKGFDFSASSWQKKDPSLIPLPLDNEVVWNKIWRFSLPTRFGQKYKDTIINAKNIHLYTYANAVDIVANENISITREILVKNYTGKIQRVRAKYFILCCAGIQNARLLLASNKQSYKGLGNNHNLVGKYFMEHLEIKSAELWLKKENALKFYMFNAPVVQCELAISPAKQAECEILNGIVSFTPLEIARKTPPFIKIWANEDPRENEKVVNAVYKKDPDGIITRLKNRINGHVNEHQAFELTIRLEQAPNPKSRVTLCSETDELGVPRAALNWEFTALEKKSILKIYEIIGQQVGAAGIGRVKLKDDILDGDEKAVPASTSGGWHHMGTTRMNNDPKSGVVDMNCKIHGIDNLFIAGSSCFPTGAGVNPTLTIVAMAIRLADHIKEKLTS